MHTYRWLSFLLIIFFCVGCGREKISIQDFDGVVWKEDRHACNNHRETLLVKLLQQKEKLLGHNEMEIVDLLGKPDENELSKRSEQFYYYYVQPGKKCAQSFSSAEKLVIRFNAVGLAKEVLVE